jgi:putative aminopeptidase FrvX
MPYAIETMPKSSGTDSMVIQVTAEGIPNEVLGIPLRYMHTSVELVSVNDILRAGRLLARFISKLTPESLAGLYEEKPHDK